MKDRVASYLYHTAFVWNTLPGALIVLPEFSEDLTDYPFYLRHLGADTVNKFTAVIYAINPTVMYSSPLSKLVKNLGKSRYLDRVSPDINI